MTKEIVFSILLSLVLISVVATPAFCFVDDGWQANITVAAGKATSRLTFGQHLAATDQNDGFYDVPALMSGFLRAAFTSGGEVLWRDIKALEMAGSREWPLSIRVNSRVDIIVRWQNNVLPNDLLIELVDNAAGKTVDMKLQSSYVVADSDSVELLIKVSRK